MAASDLASYDRSEHLKDGTAVRIRAVQPDDKDRFIAAFRNLDKETIYTRFFYHKRELSPDDLRWATEVDFVNEVALAVTIGIGEQEIIIGVGRFAKIEGTRPPHRAEVAFTVEEDYHNKGMAGLLLRHLAGIAVQLGINRFEAEVLFQNRGMLKVFEKSGLPMEKTPGGDVVHVSMSLTE